MTIEQLYHIFLQHPSLQTDTRKLQQGDIFFALKGPNFNGNMFAVQALQSGAAYAVIDEEEYATDHRCILVSDVLQTLQQLALHHRLQLHIPFIAITGSNGKTTTKELVTRVLQEKYITYATEGNLNNHIGVPLTLLRVKQDAQIAVIEMGANHQKEIEGYCTYARPTHALITNVGKAHIEGFGGPEGVKKGKGELYDFIRATQGIIFRNTDLDYLVDMSAGITQQITYGSQNAEYTGTPTVEDTLLQVTLNAEDGPVSIHTQLVGIYNFANVMTAVAIGRHFGVSYPAIKEAIEQYSPDNSRSQRLQKGTNTIILDAYNANPNSMRAAIENFAATALNNKILWIGGMKEMGEDEVKEHTELLSLIGQYTWADVILVGKEFETLPHPYRWYATSAEAKEAVMLQPPQHAAILIKGSRGSKMEVLLEAL
jgi:UDP-N-acetylmuramoyl-tripeptide--D-alanyl-D-alanine ligase